MTKFTAAYGEKLREIIFFFQHFFVFKGTVWFILDQQEFDLDVDTHICIPAGVKYSIMNLYQGLVKLYYHLSICDDDSGEWWGTV